jgi:hypothetical protein
MPRRTAPYDRKRFRLGILLAVVWHIGVLAAVWLASPSVTAITWTFLVGEGSLLVIGLLGGLAIIRWLPPGHDWVFALKGGLDVGTFVGALLLVCVGGPIFVAVSPGH